MHLDFTYAPLGMAFAALMYVIGNAAWMNHLARRRLWAGWLMWFLSAVLVLLAGGAIENRLAGGAGAWATLTSADNEKHWIIVTLYALMSVPAAASVIFRLDTRWTRIAVTLVALLVFIPLGAQLHDPENSRILFSLGAALAVIGLLWGWSIMLDEEPAPHRKTVPVEEMNA
ncbi:MAG: hypothetical protein R8K47_04090 [Mariprofundaceae bacterium]